ncbi:MAG: TatD family hydrolase [Candidatus Berkiellales bacterium]
MNTIKFVDSHCHLNMLDLTPYGGDLQQVFVQASDLNVGYFLCVGVTLDDHATLVSIAEKYSNVVISAGLHPNEKPGELLPLSQLQQAAKHPKVVAIGETGLDYYRTAKDQAWQKTRFIQHINCAKEYRKPLIIHTRAAKEDTIQVMQQENAGEIGGVMHCFTEDWDTAKKALDLGFYISFSGIVTFKNAKELQEVARKVPLDRMLIETDSPYLAPMPHRGKPNVPGFVSFVAEFIATLRGEKLETIAEQTTHNFFTLFNTAPKPSWLA